MSLYDTDLRVALRNWPSNWHTGYDLDEYVEGYLTRHRLLVIERDVKWMQREVSSEVVDVDVRVILKLDTLTDMHRTW